MSKYFAVIDTNIIVSAMLKADSVPSIIIDKALHGNITPILNDKILLEYENVLLRPKFKFNLVVVNTFLKTIKSRAIFSKEAEISETLPDLNDTVFFAVLAEIRKYKSAYLVTGNLKHFPSRPYIISPREMLDIILT